MANTNYICNVTDVIIDHKLIFKKPSGTSRGILLDKNSSFIVSRDTDGVLGIGEVSTIRGLSPENTNQITPFIRTALSANDRHQFCMKHQLPAVLFGLEMYKKSTSSLEPFELFPSSFQSGEEGIPINGLIWMGDKKAMFDQICRKLDEGFRCLKLKIGAIDFLEELDLLQYVRGQFSSDEVELRVDANGAFHPDDAMEKLNRLSELALHSIEQPIAAGQINDMAEICASTHLPIALDEELIGVKSYKEKEEIILAIRPQYIILKPSLVGGWRESEEWIEIAEKNKIGWWITSALEANVGLNAIAQWTATLGSSMYQGLGTGGLYENNVDSPLYIKDAALWYDPHAQWSTSVFDS